MRTPLLAIWHQYSVKQIARCPWKSQVPSGNYTFKTELLPEALTIPKHPSRSMRTPYGRGLPKSVGKPLCEQEKGSEDVGVLGG
jgi:hypothetical protein